jgi:RNA polymerase sigma-70 factor (ECF subfamily)
LSKKYDTCVIQKPHFLIKSINKYNDEQTLVLALKAKDKQAFSYLYDNYSDALYGVINRIVLSNEIAGDVLQEVFVKIWKNIDNYSREKGSIFTWMMNISRNAAIDQIRSRQYQNEAQNQSIENFVYDIDKTEQTTSQVDHIGLKEVLTKLKPEHKILIDKVYFEGYTHEEISQELDMPLGTVKTRIRAAIQHLRQILNVQKT